MSYKYGILFVILLLIAIFVAGCASSSTDDAVPAWTPSSTVKPAVTQASVKVTTTTQDEFTQVESQSTPITPISTQASIVKENTDTTILGEKNAAKKALQYLRFMSFSREGLIKQLEYEGFTPQEAVYGADQSGADWNKQAALKAKEYLKSMAFSQKGLIDQLEYEGFTPQQAAYGAQAVGY